MTDYKKSKCFAGSHTKLENSVFFIPSDTKLQALVYDILSPAATAVIDYAIGLLKLSANEKFFAGAQMAVTL